MLPQNPDIEYCPETRQYFFKGVRVPSVTEIVKVAGFANFTGIPPLVLEKAAIRGRRAHTVAEAVDLDLFDKDKADAEDLETAGWWGEAKAAVFKAVHKPLDELIEQIVFSNIPLYAGRLDRAWEMPGKRLIIADIKTGGVIDEKYCGLQLAGYAGALKAAYPGYLIQTLVIQIRKGFKIVPVQWADYSTYFMSAYNIYQLKMR